jgi:hypothetical protein
MPVASFVCETLPEEFFNGFSDIVASYSYIAFWRTTEPIRMRSSSLSRSSKQASTIHHRVGKTSLVMDSLAEPIEVETISLARPAVDIATTRSIPGTALRALVGCSTDGGTKLHSPEEIPRRSFYEKTRESGQDDRSNGGDN